MNLMRWDEATCSSCAIQLADEAFDIQSRLKRATPTEALIQWKCPNCEHRNETLFNYAGDIEEEQ